MLIRHCKSCGSWLDRQEGFCKYYSFWFCRDCGELMINPEVELHDELFPGVVWFCDGCGEMLNNQNGFKDNCGFWICDVCDHITEITVENIL